MLVIEYLFVQNPFFLWLLESDGIPAFSGMAEWKCADEESFYICYLSPDICFLITAHLSAAHPCRVGYRS